MVKQGETTLRDLPDDIIIEIFSYFQQRELISLQYISKRWRTLATDGRLWRYFDFSNKKNASILRMVRSAMFQNLHTIKATKTSVPTEFIQTVLNNEKLVAINLKKSNLHASYDSKEANECRKVNIDDMKCALKFLDLSDTVGDANILEEYIFYEGHHLRELGLRPITSTLIQQKIASGMPLLRVLDCHECFWFNDRLMLHISKSCIHLEYLSAMRCLSVTGKYLSFLLTGCQKLKSLNLQGTRLADSTVTNVNWAATNLEELDISHCYAIEDQGLISILPKLSKIKYLRTAVTDDALQEMASVASSIEVFELRRRYPLKVSIVSSLLRLCRNIMFLDVSLAPIESKCFRECLPNMPKLRQICFAGHETLGTSEILRELRRNCDEIESIGVNYYHANRDESLKDALINIAQNSQKVITVALQGFFVERLVQELKMIIGESLLCNKIRLVSSSLVDLPPMKNALENYFIKYTNNS